MTDKEILIRAQESKGDTVEFNSHLKKSSIGHSRGYDSTDLTYDALEKDGRNLSPSPNSNLLHDDIQKLSQKLGDALLSIDLEQVRVNPVTICFSNPVVEEYFTLRIFLKQMKRTKSMTWLGTFFFALMAIFDVIPWDQFTVKRLILRGIVSFFLSLVGIFMSPKWWKHCQLIMCIIVSLVCIVSTYISCVDNQYREEPTEYGIILIILVFCAVLIRIQFLYAVICCTISWISWISIAVAFKSSEEEPVMFASTAVLCLIGIIIINIGKREIDFTIRISWLQKQRLQQQLMIFHDNVASGSISSLGSNKVSHIDLELPAMRMMRRLDALQIAVEKSLGHEAASTLTQLRNMLNDRDKMWGVDINSHMKRQDLDSETRLWMMSQFTTEQNFQSNAQVKPRGRASTEVARTDAVARTMRRKTKKFSEKGIIVDPLLGLGFRSLSQGALPETSAQVNSLEQFQKWRLENSQPSTRTAEHHRAATEGFLMKATSSFKDRIGNISISDILVEEDEEERQDKQEETKNRKPKRSSDSILISSHNQNQSRLESTHEEAHGNAKSVHDDHKPLHRTSSSSEINTFDDFLVNFETNIRDELMECLEISGTWDFDVFTFQNLSGTNGLSLLVMYWLHKEYEVIETLDICPKRLWKFVSAISEAYNNNTEYHTSTHAIDVTQALCFMLNEDGGGCISFQLSDLELMAAVISASIHDVDHRGVTNKFLVVTHDELAIRYNDKAVQEHHHLAVAFSISRQEKCAFLEPLSRSDYETFRKAVIEIVLATDMTAHFDLIARFRGLTQDKSQLFGQNKPKRQVFSTSDTEADPNSPTEEEKLLLLRLAMHTADVSNPARPSAISLQWTDRIMKEFYSQGDKERQRDLPVSAFMDRRSPAVAKCQTSFIDYVVLPTWEALCPALSEEAKAVCMQNIRTNRNAWKEKLDAGDVIIASPH